MGRIRPEYVRDAAIDANGICLIPIVHNFGERVWELRQIVINYATQGDNPQVQITKNGQVISGAAPMLPGNGLSSAGGLAQTFAGEPYLYLENDDLIQIEVSNGSQGTIVHVVAQYRVLTYDAEELEGYL